MGVILLLELLCIEILHLGVTLDLFRLFNYWHPHKE